MTKLASNGKVFPRKVARKILDRASRGAKRVVVVMNHGRPSTVWGFEEYLEHMKIPKKHKLTEKLQAKKGGLADRLGSIDAAPPRPLTRASMYDMDED